jgi:stage V sporulation protein R
MSNLISNTSEWTFPTPPSGAFPLLKRFDKESRIAHDEFGLDTYANQIEVISSEQMIDAYSSVGLPINYHHWSFGKQFVATEQTYRRGQMGLAYEIVINSDPCIAYLMEENTLPMQALVIAHACYGHNSFFKGNYLFRPGPAPMPSSTTWSSPALHRRMRGAHGAMRRSSCCSTPATR